MKKRILIAVSAILLIATTLVSIDSFHAHATSAANPTWSVQHASLDSRIGCEGAWAFDTYTLRYEKVGTRTFLLHFESGVYNTVAGPSPMTCSEHVPALSPAVFTGWIAFEVTGGNFNPDTMCSVERCTGDTIGQGIQNFAKLTYGNSATASIGDDCFAYKGGDSDTDAGDLMQVASAGISCSVLGEGNQGDIYK